MPEDGLKVNWNKLREVVSKKIGCSAGLDDVLLYIGVREASRPWKIFTEKEATAFREVAVCTVMAPSRYYELIWVDDTGWPHFRTLRPFSISAQEELLVEQLLVYAGKNKLI
jgi:hypothetical protein